MHLSYQEKGILASDHKPGLERLLLRCSAALEQTAFYDTRRAQQLVRHGQSSQASSSSPLGAQVPSTDHNSTCASIWGQGTDLHPLVCPCALPNPVCRSPWYIVGVQMRGRGQEEAGAQQRLGSRKHMLGLILRTSAKGSSVLGSAGLSKAGGLGHRRGLCTQLGDCFRLPVTLL